jgi:hypothetical protein
MLDLEITALLSLIPYFLQIQSVIQELKYIQRVIIFVSESKQVIVSKPGISKLAIVVLAIVFAVGLFLVGFDQGHIFSVVYGEQAFTDLYIHELTHDMRHAAGFPCH